MMCVERIRYKMKAKVVSHTIRQRWISREKEKEPLLKFASRGRALRVNDVSITNRGTELLTIQIPQHKKYHAIMRVVALISGGKDSCFNMMQCEKYGHKIVALANLKPISTKGTISETCLKCPKVEKLIRLDR